MASIMLYTSVDQPQKGVFPIEKRIFGWKLAFQSNSTFKVRDTLIFFDLRGTSSYVTLHNSRLFTRGIISSEFVSKWSFSFERSNENTAFY